MTSPPYWSLRDYGVDGQIGLEKHPQEFIDRLVTVFREAKRVLKPHGSLYLNLGDTYCASNGPALSPSQGKSSIPRHGMASLAGSENPNRLLRSNGKWLQPKQLLLIPARVAAALQEDGWILRNTIIWFKPNCLPCSVKDRLTNRYEFIFHFVKSRRYFYDLNAIRIPHKRGTPQAERDFMRMLEGRKAYRGKWGLAGMQRVPVIGHPLGKNPGDVLRLTRHELAHGRPTGDSLHQNQYHPLGKNPGDFWEITTKPFLGPHFATYPPDLCVRPLLSSCPRLVCRKCGAPHLSVKHSRKKSISGANHARGVREHCCEPGCVCGAGFEPGVVFDPFAGAGTTLLVAKGLGLNWLGCDVNAKYVRLAEKRISGDLDGRGRSIQETQARHGRQTRAAVA